LNHVDPVILSDKLHAEMELPCAPPKLDQPYEDSISLEMNDGQNQIIIYRSNLDDARLNLTR
jgi:hypothetical protein